MVLDYNKGAPPLYYQIKELLKEKIENEIYATGDTLPPEIELEAQFSVSRITVRQAINELVNEGYLSRTRGKGTVVIFNKIEENLNRIMSFTEEMKIRGLSTSTKYAKINIVKLHKSAAEYLNANEGDEAYKVERLRYVNNSPMVYFVTYLKRELNLPLDESLYMGSLYELLKKNNNITVSKAKETFEAILADEYISEQLGTNMHAPILKRVRIAYDNSGNVQEYTICYYRADKYKYSIQIGF